MDAHEDRRAVGDVAGFAAATYLGGVPLVQIPTSLLAQADAGLVPMFDDSCVGVPYKLADYAVAALPVINSLGGETAQLIANYNAGIKYTAGSVASFKAALQSIVSDPSHLPSMRRNILSMARNEFDAIPIYDSYVEFAMSLFPPPQPDGTPEPEEE